MKKVSIIGAGTMGAGIAHLFAQYGHTVTLVDISREALDLAMASIERNLARQVSKGLLNEAEKSQAIASIQPHTRMEDGLSGAQLIVEAATEQADLKMRIFKELDRIADDDCILATNTSSIPITKIASGTHRPDRVIGMHFMNPVPVMKLVEIINGYATSPQVTDAIVLLSKQLGKTPCVVNDYPGFISNRILMPMINEAVYSLFEGVAGVEEIDTIMKLGMAHPMGPLQLADFICLDVCLAILRVLQDGFGQPKYAPCPLLTNMVSAGKLGIKSGEGFYRYADRAKAGIPVSFR